MTWTGQIYYCMHCKNIVKVIGEGEGVLVCCGSKMKLLEPQIEDTPSETQEKHVPVIKKLENGITVRVGSIIHPMNEIHYISWIGIEIEGIWYERSLELRESPEIFFPIETKVLKMPNLRINAREVCNRHGLWKKEIILN